jgi:hypothetical protein
MNQRYFTVGDIIDKQLRHCFKNITWIIVEHLKEIELKEFMEFPFFNINDPFTLVVKSSYINRDFNQLFEDVDYVLYLMVNIFKVHPLLKIIVSCKHIFESNENYIQKTVLYETPTNILKEFVINWPDQFLQIQYK